MISFSRPLVLITGVCLLASQLLLGCSHQSADQKTQEEQKAFKGGPAPPEVLAKIKAQMAQQKAAQQAASQKAASQGQPK